MNKRFKRIVTVLLGLALLAMSATAAFAAGDGKTVSFDGKQLSSNYSDTTVAQELFSMQPGDTATVEIELENNIDQMATWYLDNSVLQSLEETENSSANGGAYTYRLSFVQPNGVEQVLFESERIGGSSTTGLDAQASGSVGLQEVNDNLDGYHYLWSLPEHGRALVRLTVELDGETQGNDYQNTLASLQLRFAVDPVTTRNITDTINLSETVVQTGEGMDRLPFVLATGISGLLFLLLGLLGMSERRRDRKAAQKAMALALALVLACAAPAALGSVARADDGEYTVRVFPGRQGTIDETVLTAVNGNARVVNNGDGSYSYTVSYGTQVRLNINAAATDADSKYYVRGLRESGEDDRLSNLAFNVTDDLDYVVAYGVKGDMVEYTVRYQTTWGETLAPDTVYMGKVGDKPVVPYQYIEGYLPQAFNLTMTLSEDPARNVFTFLYTELDENVTYDMITGVIVIEGEPVVPPAPPAPGPGGEELPEEPTPLAPPEEMIDLDEEQTPQAGPGDGQGGGLEDLTDNATPLAGLPMAAKVGIGVACAAVLCGAAFLLIKKRKKNDAEAS